MNSSNSSSSQSINADPDDQSDIANLSKSLQQSLSLYDPREATGRYKSLLEAMQINPGNTQNLQQLFHHTGVISSKIENKDLRGVTSECASVSAVTRTPCKTQQSAETLHASHEDPRDSNVDLDRNSATGNSSDREDPRSGDNSDRTSAAAEILSTDENTQLPKHDENTSSNQSLVIETHIIVETITSFYSVPETRNTENKIEMESFDVAAGSSQERRVNEETTKSGESAPKENAENSNMRKIVFKEICVPRQSQQEQATGSIDLENTAQNSNLTETGNSIYGTKETNYENEVKASKNSAENFDNYLAREENIEIHETCDETLATETNGSGNHTESQITGIKAKNSTSGIKSYEGNRMGNYTTNSNFEADGSDTKYPTEKFTRDSSFSEDQRNPIRYQMGTSQILKVKRQDYLHAISSYNDQASCQHSGEEQDSPNCFSDDLGKNLVEEKFSSDESKFTRGSEKNIPKSNGEESDISRPDKDAIDNLIDISDKQTTVLYTQSGSVTNPSRSLSTGTKDSTNTPNESGQTEVAKLAEECLIMLQFVGKQIRELERAIESLQHDLTENLETAYKKTVRCALENSMNTAFRLIPIAQSNEPIISQEHMDSIDFHSNLYLQQSVQQLVSHLFSITRVFTEDKSNTESSTYLAEQSNLDNGNHKENKTVNYEKQCTALNNTDSRTSSNYKLCAGQVRKEISRVCDVDSYEITGKNMKSVECQTLIPTDTKNQDTKCNLISKHEEYTKEKLYAECTVATQTEDDCLISAVDQCQGSTSTSLEMKIPTVIISDEIKDYKKNKVMLLLGASGSGKTTLVKLLASIQTGIKSPSEYLSPENKKRIDGMVNQSDLTSYVLQSEEGGTGITIIDTPGLNDTSGDEIKHHVEVLENFLAAAAIRQLKIHAIAFVVQAHVSRLTPSEELVMTYVSRHFERGTEHIIPFITFADNQRAPPVIKAMKERNMNVQNYFLFNNSVLSLDDVNEVSEIDSMYWKKGQKNWKKICKIVMESPPVQIKQLRGSELSKKTTAKAKDKIEKHMTTGSVSRSSTVSYDSGESKVTESDEKLNIEGQAIIKKRGEDERKHEELNMIVIRFIEAVNSKQDTFALREEVWKRAEILHSSVADTRTVDEFLYAFVRCICTQLPNTDIYLSTLALTTSKPLVKQGYDIVRFSQTMYNHIYKTSGFIFTANKLLLITVNETKSLIRDLLQDFNVHHFMNQDTFLERLRFEVREEMCFYIERVLLGYGKRSASNPHKY